MFLALFLGAVLAYVALKRFLEISFPLEDLSRRHVVVTGADTGFGRLLALELIKNRIPTFACCLTEKGQKELREEAGEHQGRLWTLALDVTDQASVDNALAYVQSQLDTEKGAEGLWGLVNNAGVLGPYAPDDWLTVKDYQQTLDVNFFGIVRVTHAFKPLLKSRKGRLVVVTSVAGRFGHPLAGPYSASKFAAESFCDVLRTELKPFGVSVHILEPGYFCTNILNHEALISRQAQMWTELSDKQKCEYDLDYLQNSAKSIRSNFPRLVSKKVNEVVDAYYHALTSRYPKHRYYVGWDSKMLFIPMSLTPSWFSDSILQLFMLIQSAPKPRPIR